MSAFGGKADVWAALSERLFLANSGHCGFASIGIPLKD
jgi:hypothetical protein